MRRMLSIAALLSVAGLAACGELTPPTEPIAPTLAQAGSGADEAVIVVFRDEVSDVPGLARRLAAASGGELTHTYQHAIKGFAGSFPTAALDGLRRNPNVAYVEADQTMTASTIQAGATWGLDRIDQRNLPLGGTYVYDADGSGVRVYIIDTGIRLTHNDFGGRAATGFDAVTSGGTAEDCHGHGTHVAGTVGGTTWGVAKSVQLYAVRVLNCQGSGTNSGVIAGVDWVAANHVKPAVANMSLGGGASTALDAAVANAVASGVTFVVAAGNSNANACNYSPARAASAITVGSTTSTDARSSFSNYGTCVDLFAPGSSITSAWHTTNTATNTISGTSMASPHVAGAAALYLQENTSATPGAVATALTSNATPGKVTNAGTGSPNLLLHTGSGATEPPPPTAFALSATPYKVKGIQRVDLTWSGSTATSVDIYSGSAIITTTANDGAHTHNFGVKGAGTYQMKVCNAGTSTCSNTVTITY